MKRVQLPSIRCVEVSLPSLSLLEGSFVLEFCPFPFDGRSPRASCGQPVERKSVQRLRAVS